MKLPIDKSILASVLEEMDILDISCATIRQYARNLTVPPLSVSGMLMVFTNNL